MFSLFLSLFNFISYKQYIIITIITNKLQYLYTFVKQFYEQNNQTRIPMYFCVVYVGYVKSVTNEMQMLNVHCQI